MLSVANVNHFFTGPQPYKIRLTADLISIFFSACRYYTHNSCQASSDCCQWNTPEYKRIESCGDDKRCTCIEPGLFCEKGLRCCDGSICNYKCPPAAKFDFCFKYENLPNCQSGLTCTVDSVSLRIWHSQTEHFGRCL